MRNKYQHLPITKRLHTLLASLIFMTVLGAGVANGQTSGSSTLRGTVKDPNGAVIANATVTLINERTKSERKGKSSEDGGFVFNALTPDTYTVKVENQGFKTSQQTGIALAPSDTR